MVKIGEIIMRQLEEFYEHSLKDDIENENLFVDNVKGDYSYSENEFGKNANGNLEITDSIIRDFNAQKSVGDEFRRNDDDGGHLIGARFGGSPQLDNLEAQNRNLNRGSYKKMENIWNDELKDDNNVFVNISTYKQEDIDRPDAYMGYSILEKENGEREFDVFSFQNESRDTLEEWEKIVEEMDMT